MMKKIVLNSINVIGILLILSQCVCAGVVEEVSPESLGYVKAGSYWVKVFINDVRGRITVQVLNEYGEPDLTSIPLIKGEVECPTCENEGKKEVVLLHS